MRRSARVGNAALRGSFFIAGGWTGSRPLQMNGFPPVTATVVPEV